LINQLFSSFLVNQQTAPCLSGVKDEKEFPEGATTKIFEDFLFAWKYFSSTAPDYDFPIKGWQKQ
jgi:hypothetical protein